MPKRIKRYWEGCRVGKALRRVIEEHSEGSKVTFLRKGCAAETRLAFINAGKAHCVARCGGCPLTENWTPPA